jgi:hypothetical protein
MNGVARCFVAGLSLAALARLGGTVVRSSPRALEREAARGRTQR